MRIKFEKNNETAEVQLTTFNGGSKGEILVIRNGKKEHTIYLQSESEINARMSEITRDIGEEFMKENNDE